MREPHLTSTKPNHHTPPHHTPTTRLAHRRPILPVLYHPSKLDLKEDPTMYTRLQLTDTPPAPAPTPDAALALFITQDPNALPTLPDTPRLFLVGLGNAASLKPKTLQTAAAALLRAAFAAHVTQLQLLTPPTAFSTLNTPGRPLALGLTLANFHFTDHLGSAHTNHQPERDLTLSLPPELLNDARTGQAIGDATNHARTLAATPPNLATTSALADDARQSADRHDTLTCDVLEADQLAELSFGGLLAVGRAGHHPPRLVQLTHTPADPEHAKRQPVILVGKGITFDTGGYSLKATGGLHMKYDKCGGCAVLAALPLAAQLNLPFPVIGFVPLAENMVDSTAFRPDDILTMHNGVTVEITNTDAEGRLILADTLAYATAQHDPAAIIDMATLTGGVVTALGSQTAGLWANRDTLKTQLMDAAEAAGESFWRLPCFDEHRKQMTSSHADLLNSSPKRDAHPIQGAAFLSYFVGEDAPKKNPMSNDAAPAWAHLDIAGTATTDTGMPRYDKGPTGTPVPTLAEYLLALTS
ncbi:MAG: leucyl aminopeptidase family protein [Planctomycetota bacterium]